MCTFEKCIERSNNQEEQHANKSKLFHPPSMIQAVDYSYSDYDYQPEEGRSLGAEDEYYEDIAPARAYNFQFQVHFLGKQNLCLI